MQTNNASGFVCLSAAFAPNIKYMVTSESVIHLKTDLLSVLGTLLQGHHINKNGISVCHTS